MWSACRATRCGRRRHGRKPRVSAFINANFEKIEALRPDLIFAFSDLQADIAAELVRRGYAVFTFNQRSVDEILQMILVVGGIVGRHDRAEAAGAGAHDQDSTRSARRPHGWPRRPRVYFEEWDDPLISGIRWVEELCEIAGGDAGASRSCAGAGLAKDRIVDRRRGRRGATRTSSSRRGAARLSPGAHHRAVQAGTRSRPCAHGHVYEIKSSYILQPGRRR